jgi:hypothetical protein
VGRHMLHAWKLKITLPGEDAPREFEAPLPEDFRMLLEKLKDPGKEFVRS